MVAKRVKNPAPLHLPEVVVEKEEGVDVGKDLPPSPQQLQASEEVLDFLLF